MKNTIHLVNTIITLLLIIKWHYQRKHKVSNTRHWFTWTRVVLSFYVTEHIQSIKQLNVSPAAEV